MNAEKIDFNRVNTDIIKTVKDCLPLVSDFELDNLMPAFQAVYRLAHNNDKNNNNNNNNKNF